MPPDSNEAPNIHQWISKETYLLNPTNTIITELFGVPKSHNDIDCLSRLSFEESGVVDVSSEVENVVRAVMQNKELQIHLAATRPFLESLDKEFRISSILSEWVSDGIVDLYEIREDIQRNVLVSNKMFGAFINLQGGVFAVGTNHRDCQNDIVSAASDIITDCKRPELRTPPFTQVKQTLINEFSERFFQSFIQAILEIEERHNQDAYPNTPHFSNRQHVYVAILIAAGFANELLPSVSRVSEAVEIGSKSSISRIKNELEDKNYLSITTENKGVGRPVSRLHIAGLYQGDTPAMLAGRIYDDILHMYSS